MVWPVERLASSLGQLHPLRLAARQRGGRLAEAHVAEADVDERLHVAGDGRLVGEELERLLAATGRARRTTFLPLNVMSRVSRL